MFAWIEKESEDALIPDSAIAELERLFTSEQINLHGYMLIRGQKILAEKYYGCYFAEKMHRIYSVTKSFVAMAVGILVQKGMISLKDRICAYFPEYLPENGAYEWCAEMTIEDMLMMRTCFSKTTYKAYDQNSNWTESFFRTKPDHLCGTLFNYDTSAAHVLGALAEKLTGMELMDFLRKEAFRYVGFSDDAYIIKDPSGVSQGGSGGMCTLRDMAGAAYLAMHMGRVDGRQLIPEFFMRMATSDLTPTDLQPVLDEQAGYGYFFWMPRVREMTGDGFVMYGIGGQLAVCFPAYDLCFLTMADTLGNGAGLQILYDCFYHAIFPYLMGSHAERSQQFGTYDRIGNDKEKEEAFEIYYHDPNGQKRTVYSLKEQTESVQKYLFYENPHGWKRVCFDFLKKLILLEYRDSAGQDKALTFAYDTGAGKLCLPFSEQRYECAVKAYTKKGHFFLFSYMVGEENGHVGMEFAWKDKERLSIRMAATGEPFYDRLKGFGAAYLSGSPQAL